MAERIGIGELVEKVRKETGIESKTEVDKAVRAVFDVIKSEAKKGNETAIIGFGTFGKAHHDAKEGVNHFNGRNEKYTTPAYDALHFKVSKNARF